MTSDHDDDRRRFDRIVDPDVDVPDDEQAGNGGEWPILLAIAIGGVLGAEARYGVGVALPHSRSQFPLSTLFINVSGCLLLGILMVIVVERTHPHRLIRPFLGVGVLGGFTTFSSFAVDVQNLVRADRVAVGLSYWGLTLTAGWIAVWVGITAARRIRRPPR